MNARRNRRNLKAVVRHHRCQFLRDNGKPCGRYSMRRKVRVFLDSTCRHGRGWCEIWACQDHSDGTYDTPNTNLRRGEPAAGET